MFHGIRFAEDRCNRGERTHQPHVDEPLLLKFARSIAFTEESPRIHQHGAPALSIFAILKACAEKFGNVLGFFNGQVEYDLSSTAASKV